MRYFIDTSAFVALSDRTDQYHLSAIRFFKEQIHPDDQLYTSNYVVDETITRLRVGANHYAAVKFADSIYTTHTHSISVIDHAIELAALRLFKQYHDHDFSFTDCTTMVLLNQLAIPFLFAYDKASRNVGYHLVPSS